MNKRGNQSDGCNPRASEMIFVFIKIIFQGF